MLESRHFSHLEQGRLWAFTQCQPRELRLTATLLKLINHIPCNTLKTRTVELFYTQVSGLVWKMQCTLRDFSADN
jgi:hypothetical protein